MQGDARDPGSQLATIFSLIISVKVVEEINFPLLLFARSNIKRIRIHAKGYLRLR